MSGLWLVFRGGKRIAHATVGLPCTQSRRTAAGTQILQPTPSAEHKYCYIRIPLAKARTEFLCSSQCHAQIRLVFTKTANFKVASPFAWDAFPGLSEQILTIWKFTNFAYLRLTQIRVTKSQEFDQNTIGSNFFVFQSYLKSLKPEINYGRNVHFCYFLEKFERIFFLCWDT